MLTTHQLTRLRIAVRERRPEAEAPTRRVLLVHGNVSTSVFFEPLIDALPADWHIVASDLRGFGATEPKPIDGTRGLRDFSDDLAELSATLGWTSDVHALGWSVGGGVVMQLAIDHPGLVASLTLVAPVRRVGSVARMAPTASRTPRTSRARAAARSRRPSSPRSRRATAAARSRRRARS